MADEPGTATPTTPATGEGTQDRTFTQADVDRVVQDRLQRERRSTRGLRICKRRRPARGARSARPVRSPEGRSEGH
jgi:hypothetical protein